ncbi:MAG: BlaI/MecI/CopY family transcriptional regulator [Clostridia bacterium]|nr:BlaI/MecI/CopY family transcriptional regulator [Clostridia bacterium]
MGTPKIFEKEYRFCLILWEHEPISRVELAKLCEELLGWKTTTTYTVVKRLCDRGVLRNDNSIITSLVTKEQAQSAEIDGFVEEKFGGSLPAFLAAFTRKQKLSDTDLDELQKMIDQARKGGTK